MTLVRKHFCLAILMGLLIGHFGMAVHASTHAVGEASECELCLSYNDSSEDLEALSERCVAPVKETASRVASYITLEKPDWAPYLQRDPPGSS
jgi:hypothetical protein